MCFARCLGTLGDMDSRHKTADVISGSINVGPVEALDTIAANLKEASARNHAQDDREAAVRMLVSTGAAFAIGASLGLIVAGRKL